jgi:Mn2+/Fe2+ NRAMP family transporter
MEMTPSNPASRFLTRLSLFMAVMGPGIITAFVDNDAGGIATCSLVGSNFGYSMLWTIIPLTIALIVIQEMSARMGVATGKGLADLIRENYGVKATFYVMVAILIANIGTTVSEFAGVAASLELFHMSKYISVPFAALFVWVLVTKGTYQKVEKVFLISILFFGSYVAAGFMAKPDWGPVLAQTVWPTGVAWNARYLTVLIGLIGTTITPWMQFYLQSSVVEKGIRKEEYPMSRWDVITGCGTTNIITFFIMVTCAATLYEKGVRIDDAATAARALEPVAGKYCSILFAVGLLNASLAAAAILPLTTAFYICEGLGWEAGVDKSFDEAPQFYTLYGATILLGAGVVLVPGFPLWRIMLGTQVIQGVLLPFILIYMLLLINKKHLMGEFANSQTYNVIAMVTVVVLIGLTLAMVATTLWPHLLA